MPALRNLQLQFADALFDGTVEPLTSQIIFNGVDVADRLDIYRNNLREGFIKALSLGFPVIERLVGEEYFRQLAVDFQRAHPSRAGDLHHIGAPFSQFLRERFGRSKYAYLSDMAALEWAHQQVLIAADAEPISAEALRDVDPANYEHLRFDLHPASALVQSGYPIVRIWRANQPESGADEVIDLGAGGDNVLVLRTPECIEFHSLPAGDFTVLSAFVRDLPLGAALDAAQSDADEADADQSDKDEAAEPGFDLGAALRRFFSLGIIVGLQRPATPSQGS